MLNKIIESTMLEMATDRVTAEKLVTFIDVCKLKGFIGGEAASKFADYLGFLRIPDDERSHQYFADRWSDHRVWITITKDLQAYINLDTPLFTQSRLEPVYNKTPFYEQGNTKIPMGCTRNPEDDGPVRKPPRLEEAFSNFIINEFLPETFFLETFKDNVHEILMKGLPAIKEGESAYRIFTDPDEARQSLSQYLLSHGVSAERAKMHDYTLMELSVDKMVMNNDVFYTKTVSGHKGQGSNYGYFYDGAVPREAIRVSPQNRAD